MHIYLYYKRLSKKYLNKLFIQKTFTLLLGCACPTKPDSLKREMANELNPRNWNESDQFLSFVLKRTKTR